MNWISEYQLFLFDLDGLLVNTEALHYGAYKRMLAGRGYTLPWDFEKYFSIAQQDAEAPKRYIYAEFPKLQQEEPDWKVLYAEKKECYLDLLQTEAAPLMPGAEDFAARAQKARCKVCCSHPFSTRLGGRFMPQKPHTPYEPSLAHPRSLRRAKPRSRRLLKSTR